MTTQREVEEQAYHEFKVQRGYWGDAVLALCALALVLMSVAVLVLGL